MIAAPTPKNSVIHKTSKKNRAFPQCLTTFFFRVFDRPNRQSVPLPDVAPSKARALLATQEWLVTWRHKNGNIQTNTVLISGIWQLADITTQARDALFLQHDIENARILCLSMRPKPTNAALVRAQFDDESG